MDSGGAPSDASFSAATPAPAPLPPPGSHTASATGRRGRSRSRARSTAARSESSLGSKGSAGGGAGSSVASSRSAIAHAAIAQHAAASAAALGSEDGAAAATSLGGVELTELHRERRASLLANTHGAPLGGQALLSAPRGAGASSFTADLEATDEMAMMDLDADLEASLREMSGPRIMPLWRMVALGVFWWGIALWMYMFGVLLVPEEVEEQAPHDAGSALGVVLLMGSLVSVVFSPLFGSLSDHTHTRFGRRRPWLVAGVAGAFVLSLVLLGTRDSLVAYTAVFCAISLFMAAAMAPFNGLVADVVHPSQRGLASGVIGCCVACGNFSGAILSLLFDGIGIGGITVLMFVLMAAATAVTVFCVSEPPRSPIVKPQPYMTRKQQCLQYLQPFYSPGFRWVFITRLLVQMGIYTVQEFLLFYLKHAIQLPEGVTAEQALSLVMMPLLFMALVSPVAAGWLSDKLGGRRKLLVYIAGSVMTAVSAVLAFNRAWWPLPICGAVFGMGYGAFNAVDFAMALDVLPNEDTAARDLGVWNLALVIPLCLAPQIAGVLLDAFNRVSTSLGYTVLFLLACVYQAAGIYAIRRVVGVK